MDCVYFEKLICRLPDGDLTDAELSALHAHIDECDACRALCEAVTAAQEELSALEDVPEAFASNVMEAVRAQEKARAAAEERIRRNAKIRQRWRFGDLGIVAACLALVVVTLNVLYGGLGQNKAADTATAEAAPMALEAALDEEGAEAEAAAPAEYSRAATETATAGTGEAVEATADVLDAQGRYLASLDDSTLSALLSDAGGTAAATDAAPDWTLLANGTDYELFSIDGAVYWRVTGSEALTRSPMSADEFTAAIR